MNTSGHVDLIARFIAQAERRSDAPALITPEETLSYTDLRRRIERVAAGLQHTESFAEAGEPPLIGVCLPRSADSVCAVLGVLMAGGAYLPIDPSYPADARRRMAQSAGLQFVITDDARATDFVDLAQILALKDLARSQAPLAPIPSTSDRLFHVLYTSGSTDEPKGVCGSYGQMQARLQAFWRMAPLAEDAVCCHKAALHFVDASLEIFGTLLQGRPLLIAPDSHTADSETFLNLLAKHTVTRLSLVVSQLRSLLIAAPDLGDRLPKLKLWIVSGERLTQDLVEAFHRAVPGARLINLYGCSEVPEVSHCDVRADDIFPDGAAPIGRPIDGIEIHIVDEDLRPVVIGESGELLAGGPLQSMGYLNNPTETAARFINNPFGGVNRLYRTGDQVRMTADGLLVHEGRADDQVKVRGHRVELSGVEAALKRCEPAIALVKVVVQEDPRLPENRSLVAFVSPADIDTAHLKAQMQDAAPRPMQPQRIIALAALPTTPSGKIDRRALVALAKARLEGKAEGGGAEAVIRRLWLKTLMIDEVRTDANFFDVGGDSLRLAQLYQELRTAFPQFDLSLADLLAYPTIAAQVGYLRCSKTAVSAIRRGHAPTACQDIAVIGMACRFPGAETPEQFWDNLRDGIDSVSNFTDAELEQPDIKLRNDPDYVKAGAVLEDVAHFDPRFFGFTDKEAALLDPQHRVMLECAWEAMERAGIAPGGGVGRVGVYAGSGANSYFLNQIAEPPLTEATLVEYHENLANDRNFLATRIAYKLGLTGPALTVQTACSTGLVVAHMACQALRAGECELALAASVSIKTPQKAGYLYEEGMIRSPDGRCRAFDAKAQGTLFGNGAGAVLLKPLAAAQADGDPVLAVIKGSAMNNDGMAKIGYTAPSVAGQSAVIAAAMAAARFDPHSVGYVEAHGTGTRLGDPIEITALTRAYASLGWTPENGAQHCAIGAVKTNIGHLDETAGMAGLIKTVLALQNSAIPPSLHYEAPNPQINFAASPFYVNTRPTPWPQEAQTPRRAGVSAFGMGGTNCHMALEAALDVGTSGGESEVTPPQALLVLSAPSDSGLAELAERHLDFLTRQPELDLADLCATAALGRRHFQRRRAVVAASVEGMRAALAAPPLSASTGADPGKIAFVFSGQGAQYPGMARALYQTCGPFRQTLERCAAILDPVSPRPLLSVIFDNDESGALLSQTQFTQPALASIEIALTELWRSWGVSPDLVLGHSIGEFAAAHAAGVLDLEDALRAVAKRGRLMQALPLGGGMLAAGLSEVEAKDALRAHPSLCVAGINGPRSTAIAGDLSAIKALAVKLRDQGVRYKQLDVSHAFHSAAMDPMLAPFNEAMAECELSQPRIPLISNVTGDASADLTDPNYWARQARAPVRFFDGVEALKEHGVGTVIEIGPSTPLLGLIAQIDDSLTLLPSLRKGQDDWGQLLGSLGRLYEQGRDIDWDGVYRGQRWRKRLIPTSPFQRKRCWIDRPPKRTKSAPSVGDAVRQAGQRLLAQGALSQSQAELASLIAEEVERLAAGAEAEKTARLYRPTWRKQPVSDAAPAHSRGERWLILADQAGVGEAMAIRAASAGLTPLLLYQGDKFTTLYENCWTVDPMDPNQMAAFWRAHGSSSAPINRVIHLWGLDAVAEAGDASHQSAAMAQAQQAALRGALAIKPWLKNDARPSPRVCLATRGAQPVETGDAREDCEGLALAQAVIWGFGRTLALENPHAWGGLIDLDPTKDAAACGADLWRYLGAEDQLLIRGVECYAARLQPDETTSSPHIAVRPDAAYLITGGLGALGLEAAEALADLGARHLILTSRSGATTEAQHSRLEALRRRGVALHTPIVDASDWDAMGALFIDLRANQPPLKGVLHAAGVIAPEAATEPDAARIASVINAKAVGAWTLHLLSEDLDLFVLFSSAASLLGLRGHTEYASANAFLDALAAHRRAQGLPGLSVNWGDWAGTGMAARVGASDSLVDIGLGDLPLDEARAALRSLIGQQGHWAMARADWPRFIETFQAHHAFLSLCSAPEPLENDAAQSAAPTNLLDVLQAASDVECERLIRNHLTDLVDGLLGSGTVDPAENLLALGLDSLMLISLRNKIRQSLGVEIKLAHILQGPSVNTLTTNVGALAVEPRSGLTSETSKLDSKETQEDQQWTTVII